LFGQREWTIVKAAAVLDELGGCFQTRSRNSAYQRRFRVGGGADADEDQPEHALLIDLGLEMFNMLQGV
jgi:hypothetical protein